MNLITLLLASQTAAAAPAPLSVSLYMPYGNQPGLKVGYTLDAGPVLITPQVGVFARADNHISTLAGLDIGRRLQQDGRSRYSVLSLGSAYIAEAQITAESVDLATGERTPTRQLRHYLVPTASEELGWEGSGVFVKLTVGYRVSPQVDGSLFTAVEVGMRLGGAQ